MKPVFVISENLLLFYFFNRKRRKNTLHINRRTSKEITFKGEDEMLIRSYNVSEEATTLHNKPLPRIDIDAGSLQALANVSDKHYSVIHSKICLSGKSCNNKELYPSMSKREN